MKRERTVLFVLALVSALVGCDEAGEKPAPSTRGGAVLLGVLPAADPAAVREAYGPLVKELGTTLGRPVELVIPATYDDLLAMLRASELQLAQLSAAAFVQARGVISGQVLAQQKMDYGTEYRGAFIAKKGVFAGLTALEGKRFAFVDRHSSAGYWYPRIRLRQNKFDPDRTFSAVLFAGSHQKVIDMLREGKADAGAVSERSIAGAADLEALEVTNPIPDDVIVAVGGLSQQEQEDLRALLLNAAASPALAAYMKSRNIRAFAPHNLDEYAMLEMELQLSGALLEPVPAAKH